MKDRSVQFPNRYRLVPVQGTSDIVDIVPAPGEVTEVGTAVNKATLLTDETAGFYGLGVDSVPDTALNRLGKSHATLGSFAASANNLETDTNEFVYCDGRNLSASAYPKYADKFKFSYGAYMDTIWSGGGTNTISSCAFHTTTNAKIACAVGTTDVTDSQGTYKKWRFSAGSTSGNQKIVELYSVKEENIRSSPATSMIYMQPVDGYYNRYTCFFVMAFTATNGYAYMQVQFFDFTCTNNITTINSHWVQDGGVIMSGFARYLTDVNNGHPFSYYNNLDKRYYLAFSYLLTGGNPPTVYGSQIITVNMGAGSSQNDVTRYTTGIGGVGSSTNQFYKGWWIPELGRILAKIADSHGGNATYKCLLPTSNSNLNIPELVGKDIVAVHSPYLIDSGSVIYKFNFSANPPTVGRNGVFAPTAVCNRLRVTHGIQTPKVPKDIYIISDRYWVVNVEDHIMEVTLGVYDTVLNRIVYANPTFKIGNTGINYKVSLLQDGSFVVSRFINGDSLSSGFFKQFKISNDYAQLPVDGLSEGVTTGYQYFFRGKFLYIKVKDG